MTLSPPQKLGKAADHLANERTFLAWIRTSISIIVFGFVVAKFGITLREFLRVQGNSGGESGASLLIGVAFMAIGVFMALIAMMRYRTTMHRLDVDQFEPAGAMIVVLGAAAALFGVILAIYVVFTAQKL
jgi:putative membrane protein